MDEALLKSAVLPRFAAYIAPELAPLGTSERAAWLVGGQAFMEQGPLAAFQGVLPGAEVPASVAWGSGEGMQSKVALKSRRQWRKRSI